MGVRKERIIWLVILIGLTLRLISLNQSLWLDEAINTLATQNYSLRGMVTEYAKGDFHPPLHFIILWIWSRIFGISEISVRFPSVIFGVITIVVTYSIAQKLYSRKVGLLSALLLAINPLHIYYSQEARMYALAALAVSINIYLLIKLIKEEKINIVFLILINLLVLGSDYLAYFIFPAELIFILIYKRELWKKWSSALVFSVLLGIWWIPVLLSQFNIGSVASHNLPTWKLVVGGFDVKAVPLTYIKFIIGRISLADKLIYSMILLPISLLFGYILYIGAKAIKSYERGLLIIWLLVPILIGTIISISIPIYSYFRLLFILPAFIILIALGITSSGKLRQFFLIVVVLIELFSASVYLFNSSYQREDWKGLVNFLKSQPKNMTVLFESSGTLPPFDYYTQNSLIANGALRDFPARESKDVLDLRDDLSKSEDVYLVDYLVDISDPNRLVAKKLIELGYHYLETKNFNGVGFVYHYQKNE